MRKLIFRLFGGAVVVVAAIAFALGKNAEEASRIKKCKLLLDFIRECKLQIECFSLPVDRILEGYEEKWKDGAEFIIAARSLGVEKAARKYAPSLLDGAEERELFAAFTTELGRGYKGEEVARCLEYIEKLKVLIGTLESDAAAKGKLRITVFACVSLMAVLFFA